MPAEPQPHPQPDAAPLPSRRALWLALFRAAATGELGARPAALRQAWHDLRAHQAVAELWQGDRLVKRLELGQERVRIGRDPACELALEAPGLSRVHAILERRRARDRDLALDDFDSANGLFHRDRRIRSIALRDGDVVFLGSALKGDTPALHYHHRRSALELAVHGLGVVSLVGSAVVVSGMLLASTIAGGSRIRVIDGPVKILAADGRQIDAQQGSATALPSLADYPLHLRQALIASEEARFGWNSGIDLFGTLRSALLGSGGGSGLTQQVARLYYASVGRDVTLTRKLRELWVALQLEVGYSKNRILKMYLDRAHLGLGADGFEQAAQLYFRKSARDLDVAESAFLVGLLPSPNGYSPCYAPSQEKEAQQLEEALLRRKGTLSAADQERIEAVRSGPWLPVKRRNLVLGLMHEQGQLGDQALLDAQRQPLNFDQSACSESTITTFPFFSDYVLSELRGQRFGLNAGGVDGGNYVAVSTIDQPLQALAQEQLRRFLEGPAARVGLTQGAVISLRPSTGAILAYVGGGNYASSSFDRVQALRQPGSTFKLFPFLAALQAGVTENELISCAPHAYVAGCRSGTAPITVSDGVARSENVVALRVADRAGLSQVVRLTRRLGLSTAIQPDYSAMLGGNETFLYEMARAYAVVANGGRWVPMHGVTRIYDLGVCQSVQSLAECPERGVTIPLLEEPRQLIPAEHAATMDRMLRAVVERGTGRGAALVADARGKTGTTDNGVDVLFIGYSPAMDLLTAIWMGNDDNKPAEAASGGLVAELWGRYMKAAVEIPS
ncbi:MAG: FHA domain-containing protein [Cyanobacteria bacterium M_surface_10_m2_119]|nr:FHA domain-containing protein [Cyanobacteria bacterium M_surface_10_m2_119]